MEPKKFLYVSLSGLIGDIAWQVLKEGHEVRYFIGAEDERDIADGFVPKSDDWETDAEWADVIVFDDTLGQGAKAQALRMQGKARGRRHAVHRPARGRPQLRPGGAEEGRASTSFPTASSTTSTRPIAFVRENPARYVIKPSGEAQNVKRRLFVGEEDDGARRGPRARGLQAARSPTEIPVFQLQTPRHRRRGRGRRLLQRPRASSRPININFEHKKLFPGNLGPVDRRDGHVDVLDRAQPPLQPDARRRWRPLLARGALRRLHRPQLHRQRQRHLPARVHRPLRLPDDLHPAGRDDHADRPVLPRPRRTASDPKLKVKSGFQVGVRVIVPPYPFDDPGTFESLSKDARHLLQEGRLADGVHIEDAKLVNGQWLVAGTSGVVLMRRRHRPDDEGRPAAGLLADQEHPDPQHVLPRRHRRPLERRLGPTVQLGVLAADVERHDGVVFVGASLACPPVLAVQGRVARHGMVHFNQRPEARAHVDRGTPDLGPHRPSRRHRPGLATGSTRVVARRQRSRAGAGLLELRHPRRGAIGADPIMRALLPVGRSGWAIAAGYLGLFSMLFVFAPFAILCGWLAIRDIVATRRNTAWGGRSSGS